MLIELVEGKESSLLSNKNINFQGEEVLEDSSIIKTMIDREGLSKKKEKTKRSKKTKSKNRKKLVEVEVPKKTKKLASERKPRKRSKKRKARE